MDWNKAKSFTIAFLIILNLILLGMNVSKHITSSVGTARIETITSLAAKRDIKINCILPGKHPSMPQIIAENYTYDYLQLEQLFFDNLNGITRTDDNSSTVFTNGTATLTVSGSSFKYTDTASTALSGDNAVNSAALYAGKINAVFGKYAADSTIVTDKGVYITYYDTLAGYNIFNNYLKFFYPSGGGISIEGSYCTPTGTDNTKQPTIASDEAVYAAFDNLRTQQPTGTINITSVSLGYYSIEPLTSDEQEILPYYMIQADNLICYVNAYNGEVIQR